MKQKIAEELIFYMSKSAQKWYRKELKKVKLATQYIGEGVVNSSTDRYKRLYEKYNLANTGNYTEDDIIWVSSNGKRKNRFNPVIINDQVLTYEGILQGAYKNIDLGIKANCTFIMDTLDHLEKTKLYNIGELQLMEYLKNNNYRRIDRSGIWRKK